MKVYNWLVKSLHSPRLKTFFLTSFSILKILPIHSVSDLLTVISDKAKCTVLLITMYFFKGQQTNEVKRSFIKSGPLLFDAKNQWKF